LVEYSLCSVRGNIIFLSLDLKVLIEGVFFKLTYLICMLAKSPKDFEALGPFFQHKHFDENTL